MPEAVEVGVSAARSGPPSSEPSSHAGDASSAAADARRITQRRVIPIESSSALDTPWRFACYPSCYATWLLARGSPARLDEYSPEFYC